MIAHSQQIFCHRIKVTTVGMRRKPLCQQNLSELFEEPRRDYQFKYNEKCDFPTIENNQIRQGGIINFPPCENV